MKYNQVPYPKSYPLDKVFWEAILSMLSLTTSRTNDIKKSNKVPLPKKCPRQILLKISLMHAFITCITNNFPKFRVYRFTNVDVNQATTYYDTILTESLSQKCDLLILTDFSENQSNPCFNYYWQLPKVSCTSINKYASRRYPGHNIF
jgi:hypothetical protein